MKKRSVYTRNENIFGSWEIIPALILLCWIAIYFKNIEKYQFKKR